MNSRVQSPGAARDFVLIGAISRDEITREGGGNFVNLGGVLYQAAVLCGLGRTIRLYTHLADGLAAEVESLTADWLTLGREGLVRVPGPGNRVRLSYPLRGERVEVLRSAVPPLDPGPILHDLSGLSFLIMVINSGFDIELESWRRVADASTCPIWLDIHSLSLEKVLLQPRAYRAVPEWEDWARGVTYLQANRQEVACMLGLPEREAQPADIRLFCRRALDLGLSAVFITLGSEGALVSTVAADHQVEPSLVAEVVDTTGCGDVFCAATSSALSSGASPEEAVRFGVDLASRAAQVAGVRETYELALRWRQG